MIETFGPKLLIQVVVILTCLFCILYKEYRGLEQHETGLNPGWYVVIIILILFISKGDAYSKDDRDKCSL